MLTKSDKSKWFDRWSWCAVEDLWGSLHSISMGGVLKGHLLLILMEVFLWLIPCMFQWSCKMKNLKLRQCLCNVDYINTCMFIVNSLCWTCIYVKLIIIIKFKLNRLGKDHTWSWKSGIKMWQANTLFLSFFAVIRRLMIDIFNPKMTWYIITLYFYAAFNEVWRVLFLSTCISPSIRQLIPFL